MVRILTENGYLSLPDGFRLAFEDSNSAFDFDIISNPFSFSEEIPLENNADILGNQAALCQEFPQVKIPIVVSMGAVKWANSFMTILEIVEFNKQSHMLSCDFELGGLTSDLEGAMWNEVDMGQIKLIGNLSKAMLAYNTSSEPVLRFPLLLNKSHYDNSNPYFGNPDHADNPEGIINYWDVVAENFKLNSLTGAVSSYAISPQFHLVYALSKGLAALGWTLKGSIINDPDALKLLVMNNFTLDSYVADDPLAKVHYPLHHTSAAVTEWDEIIEDEQSLLDDNTHTFQFNRVGPWNVRVDIDMHMENEYYYGINTFHFYIKRSSDDSIIFQLEQKWDARYSHVISGVLNVVAGYVGIDLYFELKRSAILAFIQGWDDATVQIRHLDDAGVNLHDAKIVVNEHMPAISMNDALITVRSHLAMRLSIDPEVKHIFLDFIKDDLNSQVTQSFKAPLHGRVIEREIEKRFSLANKLLNGTDYQVPSNVSIQQVEYPEEAEIPQAGIYVYSSKEHKWYITVLIVPDDPDPPYVELQYFCEDPHAYIFGETGSIESRDSEMAIAPMRSIILGNGHLLAPDLDGTGSSKAYPIGVNQLEDLCLTTWHGMVQRHSYAAAPSPSTYPYASTYTSGPDSRTAPLGGIELTFSDHSDSILKHHAKFLRSLIKSEFVTVTDIRSSIEALRMNKFIPILDDGKKLYIESLQFEMGEIEEQEVEIKALVIRP